MRPRISGASSRGGDEAEATSGWPARRVRVTLPRIPKEIKMALPVEDRVAALDWPAIDARLDAAGHAVTGPLLSPAECAAVAARYADDDGFRSRVVMARHGYGQGE